MKKFYAHSTESTDKSSWQPLEEHLKNVAGMAGNFASAFDAREWGIQAGLLHDAGKTTFAFQERLEGQNIRVDHSTFGARIAWQHCGRLGMLLAYAITGHHGGLPDGGEQRGQLHYRLKHAKIPEGAHLLPGMGCSEDLHLPFRLARETAGFSLSFFTRMLFSCLVDADFLDTERFCSPEKARVRDEAIARNVLPKLRNLLLAHVDAITRTARPTPVNVLRSEIFRQCREKAALPRHFFSLTVPTGGGKTLSSMGFALEHACRHHMRRIIYAIPFTSIIEQNAKVFADIFGQENVLEHHCNVVRTDDDGDGTRVLRHQLATENWDMPIVITTNVQFFESLFACRTSRCRKLHNIAGSVIILDEAQAVPTEFLKPCLLALRELVERYGCTVLLCTATQPALDDLRALDQAALANITEIVDDPSRAFQRLQRVEVSFIGKKSDRELAALLEKEPQVLCVVSTRPQARRLFESLPADDSTFHLSTTMYPLHRKDVLRTIGLRLRDGSPCRVISTSLVEAGVDLDFPVVYRAMAGLDSIAQAAGRCNREGLLNTQGRQGQVFVYEPETMPAMPWLKRCVSRAQEALRAMPDRNPLGPDVIRRYFQLLYDVQELDNRNILQLLNPFPLDPELNFAFREAAGEFRFIREDTVELIIPHEPETGPLVHALRYIEYTRSTLRKLQPFMVSVRRNDIETMIADGGVEVINEKFHVLANTDAYDCNVGLRVDRAGNWEAESLLV